MKTSKKKDPRRRSSLDESDLRTLNIMLKEEEKYALPNLNAPSLHSSLTPNPEGPKTLKRTISGFGLKKPSSKNTSGLKIGSPESRSSKGNSLLQGYDGPFVRVDDILSSPPQSPQTLRSNTVSVPHITSSNSAPTTPVQKTTPPTKRLSITLVDEENVNKSDTSDQPTNDGKTEEPPAATEVKLDERLKIVDELWDTERQYVSDLEVIVNMYLIPLRDVLKNREAIIPSSELPKVFSNVETLLSVNSEVLAQLDIALEKGFQNDHVQKILTNVAKVFIKMYESFKVYAEYCAMNPIQIEALNHLSKNPNYVAYEDLSRQSCNKIRLDGYIAKPVQRVLKYPLFFGQLVKATKPEEECYPTLKKGMEAVEGIAKYINEYKNQKDNREKLQHIDAVLHGMKQKVYQPGRIFYREALFNKIGPKSKRPDVRKFWLFNDCTIYAKEKGSSFVFKGMLLNHQLLVRDNPNPAQPNSFQLKVTDNRLYTILCKSEIEKNEWLKDYRKVIDEATLKQDKSVQVAKALLAKDFQ